MINTKYQNLSFSSQALALYIAGVIYFFLYKRVVVVVEGWGGWGYRSRFTENKTALSKFTKNMTSISRFTENIRERFGKSRFTATMEITIHEEKIAISHFTGNKNNRSRVTKIPFTTLIQGILFYACQLGQHEPQ